MDQTELYGKDSPSFASPSKNEDDEKLEFSHFAKGGVNQPPLKSRAISESLYKSQSDIDRNRQTTNYTDISVQSKCETDEDDDIAQSDNYFPPDFEDEDKGNEDIGKGQGDEDQGDEDKANEQKLSNEQDGDQRQYDADNDDEEEIDSKWKFMSKCRRQVLKAQILMKQPLKDHDAQSAEEDDQQIIADDNVDDIEPKKTKVTGIRYHYHSDSEITVRPHQYKRQRL